MVFVDPNQGIVKEICFPWFGCCHLYEGAPDVIGIMMMGAAQVSFLVILVIVFVEFLKRRRGGEGRRAGYLLGAQILFFIGIINDSLIVFGMITSIYLIEYCFLFLLMSTVFATSEELLKASITQEEKQILQEQLAENQKVESLGRLASGIAHDFNNLLVPIICISDLLEQDLEENDPMRDDLRQISQAGCEAQKLTRQLLAYSRKQALKIEVFDLNEYLTETVPFLRRMVREDIQLNLKLSKHQCNVSFDQSKFHQILMNLVVNSVHAMPNGGVVSLSTNVVEVDSAHKKVFLYVSDTGPGIKPEIADQIFEPFFTTKPEDEGTGLGLSTVFGIIKQHNGDIALVSSERGARFKISLPYCESILSSQKTSPGILKEPSDLTAFTQNGIILVVEDDPNVRKMVERILGPLGVKLVTTPNAESAINIFDGNYEDIILLLSDVILPGMSGWELYKEICKEVDEVNVLFMSGYAGDLGSGQELLPKGIDYLQKPFSADAIKQAVLEKINSGAETVDLSASF